jgi:hypothetical protein
MNNWLVIVTLIKRLIRLYTHPLSICIEIVNLIKLVIKFFDML